MINLILNTDSYKTSHYQQYPPATEVVSSYIESRGGRYSETVFFGLQAFIKAYLSTPLSSADIDQAESLLQAHGVPFNRAGWQYIVEQHNGYLPVEIEAVPEGTQVPAGNVMLQIKNTDPQCAWLTSYLETALLRAIWYPSTVATVSKACKNIIQRYLHDTADNCDSLPFKLHDFGARGASSEETAALGGMAHLIHFLGSDTLSALVAAQRFYAAETAGFSIPAAEHSTITSWGKDGECAAYANMLDQFGGDGRLLAVVSDSYDLWHAIEQIWGKELKNQVEQMGGTLVIRPDSGDPVSVVTETIERLMTIFGSHINTRGYRVLPDYLRVIQGDGISVHSIENILAALKERGISAENVAFGMGAELLQKVNRDTLKFAMKASAIQINGHWHDIYKDPITDPGKRSKRGRLALIATEQGVKTIREDDLGNASNLLHTVFRNGQLLKQWSFEQVRQHAELDYSVPALDR